ncbi:MAG: LapA family protein [Verrucomicrobiota bacterium]
MEWSALALGCAFLPISMIAILFYFDHEALVQGTTPDAEKTPPALLETIVIAGGFGVTGVGLLILNWRWGNKRKNLRRELKRLQRAVKRERRRLAKRNEQAEDPNPDHLPI